MTKSKSFIDPLFSKPIYGKTIDIDIKKIVSMLKEYDFPTAGLKTDTNASSQSNSLYVLDEERFKFLKDELDDYLRGRANESKFEKTLLDNDSQQYVWYQKGGLVLYALQDLIGEKKLNDSFKKYVDSTAYKPKAPFTTTKEWYSYIQAATPDSLKYFIEDSFEKITLYSNKVTNATYKKIDGGNYEVTLDVESTKNYYGGNGKLLETGETPNVIEIGVFENDTTNTNGMTIKSPIYLEKKWVRPGKSTFTIIVDKLPIKAGIDPYNKMIDRIPDDNLKAVEEVE